MWYRKVAEDARASQPDEDRNANDHQILPTSCISQDLSFEAAREASIQPLEGEETEHATVSIPDNDGKTNNDPQILATGTTEEPLEDKMIEDVSVSKPDDDRKYDDASQSLLTDATEQPLEDRVIGDVSVSTPDVDRKSCDDSQILPTDTCEPHAVPGTSTNNTNAPTEQIGKDDDKVSIAFMKIGDAVAPYPLDTPKNSRPLQEEARSSTGDEPVAIEEFSFRISELRTTHRDMLSHLFDKMNLKAPPKQVVETKVKFPEKLIFVLDTGKDDTFEYFEDGGVRLNAVTMVKHCLMNLLNMEGVLPPNHQVALITMNKKNCTWVHGYSEIKDFMNALSLIKECKPKDTFNMNTVFETIMQNDEVCKNSKLNIPPHYIIRVMFFYGRSNTDLKLSMTDEISKLLNSSYFIFDVLTSHVITDKSKKACHCLKNLDAKGHFFAVGRNTIAMQSAICAMFMYPSKGALPNMADDANNPKK